MTRITKAQVQGIFERFIGAIGGFAAQSYNDVGGYTLDNIPSYGGYVIEKISNSGGGVSQPFGSTRRSPREMWDTLRFAMDTIRELDSLY